MYKILDFTMMDEQEKYENISQLVVYEELASTFDDIAGARVIGLYNQYSLLIRSGYIHELVRFGQKINPNYKLPKIPHYNKYRLLETSIGSLYQYEQFMKDLDHDDLAPIEDTTIVLDFYKNMVDAIDRSKSYLLSLDVLVAVNNILAEYIRFTIDDLSRGGYYAMLPHLKQCYTRYFEDLLGHYSLGQVIIDREAGTRKDYWRMLKIVLYGTIYSTSEDVSIASDDAPAIDDRISSIDNNHTSLPDTIVSIEDVAGGNLSAFSYKVGELEAVYSGTIGLLCKLLNNTSGEDSNFDDCELRSMEVICQHDSLDIKVVVKMLVDHYNETRGIISELYRVVQQYNRKTIDDLDMRQPISAMSLDDRKIYSKLFKNISELCAYSVSLRMTISLIYARYQKN